MQSFIDRLKQYVGTEQYLHVTIFNNLTYVAKVVGMGSDYFELEMIDNDGQQWGTCLVPFKDLGPVFTYRTLVTKTVAERMFKGPDAKPGPGHPEYVPDQPEESEKP